MRVDRLLLLGAVAALTVGCQQDSGGNEPVPDAAVIDRGLADAERLDAAPMPDEGPMLDEGSPADAMSDGPIADAEADGAPPPPDMGGPRVVESCEQACAVYAECDRLDLFGDEAACLDRCARVTRTGVAVAQGWWDCLAVEQCNLVHLCPIPRLMPLTCDEICGALDDCDTGLPFNDCPATCAAGERAFQDCGEALFGGCDAEGFVDCLGHDVYPACADYCTRGAGCNVIRPEGCLVECVGHITLGDPLAAAQQSRINQCVRLAGEDCQRVDECVQPFSFEPPGVVAEAEFCRLYDACNFEFGDPCPGFYANAVRQGPETVACMVGIMRGACPDFSFDLEDLCSNAGGQVVAEACSRFCGAQTVCGVLDGAQAQCNLDCNSAFGDDPDLNERVGSQVLCAGSATCPDLVECLANASPEGQCERYCGRLDECGALPPDCQAECDAEWPRDRFAAVRQCVADAADCAAVTACAPAPAVPCGPACARLGECGLSFQRCEVQCDDLHAADPVTGALYVGCILSAPVCQSMPGELAVADCLDDPEAAGRACLNFCRAETACAPAADLSACLTRCVGGFGDGDGLRFAAAEACLDRAARDADCAVLQACIPAEPMVDCAAHCGRLDDCRLADAGCEAACQAAPDANVAGCVADAVRTGQECGGVAQCIGFAPPRPSAACVELCALQDDCDRAFDPYLCRLDCPEPPALDVQLGCLQATVCGRQAGCLDLAGDLNAACAAPCATAVACGVFPDQATCEAICTGQAAGPFAGGGYFDRLNACLAAAAPAGGQCNLESAEICFRPALCEALPDVLVAPPGGGRLPYNTVGRQSVGRANCGGGGPQQVVVITVAVASTVDIVILDATYDPLIHLRRSCDDPASEIACNDDSNGLLSALRGQQLAAGTYFLYLDGFGGGQGSGTVEITIRPN